MRGAEANIIEQDGTVIKDRIPKTYRHPVLDARLRTERTRKEARILRLLDSIAPRIIASDTSTITMERLEAVRDITNHDIPELAHILRILHEKGVTHGDVTPKNIIITANGMRLIDYGLSSRSRRIEDRAYDIAMTYETFSEAFAHELLNAYEILTDEPIRERVETVLGRGRHKRKAH